MIASIIIFLDQRNTNSLFNILWTENFEDKYAHLKKMPD